MATSGERELRGRVVLDTRDAEAAIGRLGTAMQAATGGVAGGGGRGVDESMSAGGVTDGAAAGNDNDGAASIGPLVEQHGGRSVGRLPSLLFQSSANDPLERRNQIY